MSPLGRLTQYRARVPRVAIHAFEDDPPSMCDAGRVGEGPRGGGDDREDAPTR